MKRNNVERRTFLSEAPEYQITDSGVVYGKRGHSLYGSKASGYHRVSIKTSAGYKSKSVHRLVWESFNGPIPNGYVIDHINSDTTDNRLSNLRCVTQKENMNNPVTKSKLSKPRIRR